MTGSNPPAAAASPSPATRMRPLILGLAILRYGIPVAALPLVPRLIPDDVGLLTLLRPNKEVILLAGGLTKTDSTPGIIVTFLAYLPFMVGGVWVFFALGRAYADDLAAGTGPDWLHRMVPDERLRLARRVLTRKGPSVALIGRVAAMPPTIIAAAAGTSDVDTRRFLAADLVGAIIAFAMIFGIGLALGEAYESGGPWLTAGAVGALILGAAVVSRWLQREAERLDAEDGPPDPEPNPDPDDPPAASPDVGL